METFHDQRVLRVCRLLPINICPISAYFCSASLVYLFKSIISPACAKNPFKTPSSTQESTDQAPTIGVRHVCLVHVHIQCALACDISERGQLALSTSITHARASAHVPQNEQNTCILSLLNTSEARIEKENIFYSKSKENLRLLRFLST